MFAKKYAKNTKANFQRDILEGELSTHFANQARLWATMSRIVCNLQEEIARLQASVTRDSPDYLADSLHGSRDIIRAEILGDGYRLGRCKEIPLYDIIWSRKLNRTCFLLLPVIPPNVTPKLPKSLSMARVALSVGHGGIIPERT